MYFIYFIRLTYWILLNSLDVLDLLDCPDHTQQSSIRGARFAPHCVVFIVVCDQVNQVDPAHQVNKGDEVHQVDPVHQVNDIDEVRQVNQVHEVNQVRKEET